MLTCHELAGRIESLAPEISSADVARLCLLILNQAEQNRLLEDESELKLAWKNASFRLESALDQYAAVAEELDGMCGDGPVQFNPQQLWMLLRAVKVQGQILELYTDQPTLV